jgi:hypothetical protein
MPRVLAGLSVVILGPIAGPEPTVLVFISFFYESLHFESFFVFLALEKSNPDMCDEIAAYLVFNFL